MRRGSVRRLGEALLALALLATGFGLTAFLVGEAVRREQQTIPRKIKEE